MPFVSSSIIATGVGKGGKREVGKSAQLQEQEIWTRGKMRKSVACAFNQSKKQTRNFICILYKNNVHTRIIYELITAI